MHSLLTQHPRWVKAVEEVARIRQVRDRFGQQTERAEVDFRTARSAYEVAAKGALTRGEPTPPRPSPPEVDAALAQQLAAEAVDAPRFEREALAELAGELLPQLEERAAELEETFRQAEELLRAAAREASELRVTAAALRSASGGLPLVDQGVVDVLRMFELVGLGGRLLLAVSPRPTPGDAGLADPSAPRGSQGSKVVSFSLLAGRR